MSLSHDILAELAEIKPGSPLAEARATRDAATRHAQGSYEILFSQQDADFALDERLSDLKQALQLDENSVVLCFNTEGDTDKENYRRIVWDGAYSRE